jgi:riboflavin kinase/FMN adenylyltransferase
MSIFVGWDDIHLTNPQVITIGVFDGVHQGHQHLVANAAKVAAEMGAELTVITFWPPPPAVLIPEHSIHCLTLEDEKRTMLGRLPAVSHIIQIPFTRELSQLSASEFLNNLRACIPIVAIVEGDDFHLGHNREGNLQWLSDYGTRYHIRVVAVARQQSATKPISSSRIRALLDEGDLQSATAMLDYSYQMIGTVIHGDKRGRLLGYPTANLQLDPWKLIPANGVYATCVWRVDRPEILYYGATSIGLRPVFHGTERRCEVHILDFDDTIYDEQLLIALVRRLRSEEMFPSIDELIKQMGQDVSNVRQIFAESDFYRQEMRPFL